jgi:hypothetical protein
MYYFLRSWVKPERLEVMRAMQPLRPEAPMPIPGLTLKMRIDDGPGSKGAVFTVLRESAPVMTCVLAVSRDDASSWRTVEPLHADVAARLPYEQSLPDKPPSLPWMTTAFLRKFDSLNADAWQALAEFRCCMAWLLIDHLEREPLL